MKKMGHLMKDMGFNPNASTSAQEAFIKHLIKAAHGVDVMTPSEKKIIRNNPQKIVRLKSLGNPNQQMAFDFEAASEFNFSNENSDQPNKKTGS